MIKEKNKLTSKQILSPGKNPFHWYAFVFAIWGGIFGGMIGGMISFLTGYLIIKACIRKDYSTGKKLVYTIIASTIAIVLYAVVVSLFKGIVEAIWGIIV